MQLRKCHTTTHNMHDFYPSVNPYLIRFIHDCEVKGMTRHSVETYISNLREFLASYPQPCKVTIEDLRWYLNTLRSRKLATSTLKGYLSAVSSFFDFLLFEREIQINPIVEFRKRHLDHIKVHQESRQLISIEDMRAVYQEAEDIEDIAIILTLAKTGMRRGELHGLKEFDINFKKKIIHIPAKAKRSNCIAFIDPELDEVLKEYLAWRKDHTKSDWLWISKRGGRIHRDVYTLTISDIGERLHLHIANGCLGDKLTAHCFRHWFTSHLFRSGMNPQYIKFLRGDSMRGESWQIYNRIDIDLVRAEYLKHIPRLIMSGYLPGYSAGYRKT